MREKKPNLNVNDIEVLKAEREQIKCEMKQIESEIDNIGNYYVKHVLVAALLVCGGTGCLLSGIQLGIELAQASGSMFDAASSSFLKPLLFVVDCIMVILSAGFLGQCLTQAANRRSNLFQMMYSYTDILNSFNMRISMLEQKQTRKGTE